jgi:CRP-like cAMP-binding protein
MSVTSAAPENHLLTAMSSKHSQRLQLDCDSVNLRFNQVLAESGELIHHVYFPTESFISLVTSIDSHARMGVGLVGNEGMLGISLILGVDVSPLSAVVQGEGRALRMKAAEFRRHFEQNPALQRVLRNYLYVVNKQLAKTAACTHFHLVEMRLARWLLMSQDRAQTDTFHVTHEFLADMLGVRRVGITKAATSLKNRKLVQYSRGDITVIDRDGLEAASCHCYAADTAIYIRMMGKNKAK